MSNQFRDTVLIAANEENTNWQIYIEADGIKNVHFPGYDMRYCPQGLLTFFDIREKSIKYLFKNHGV